MVSPRERRVALAALAAGVALAIACATGETTPLTDGGTTGDAQPTGDACAFDLQNDPNHCGSCTKACAADEVCTAGACKSSCTAPSIKCSGDAQSCVDVTKDPNNCGKCGIACGGADSGPESGTGNPDSGIPTPDGGYDAGTGWSLAIASCDGGACALACGGASNLCSDELCWDTTNAHDHCGDCTTACAADVEWCTSGHCCPTGQEYCGSACQDVLSDPSNCGACGNVCPNSAPACSGGICTAPVSVTTVCSKVNSSGILCSGNCSNNHAQYADAYCKLAGYTKAASYTVLTSGSVNCLYYNTQTVVPTVCSDILGPTTYGLDSACDAISNLKCE